MLVAAPTAGQWGNEYADSSIDEVVGKIRTKMVDPESRLLAPCLRSFSGLHIFLTWGPSLRSNIARRGMAMVPATEPKKHH